MEYDPQLQYLYIVHGYNTLEFAKMLPDWTITEFLTELENLFDATFIINERDKTVSFLYNYRNTFNKPKQTLTIMDEYSTEVDKENLVTKSVSNVGYNLVNNIYHEYQYLKEDVLADARLVNLPDLDALETAINDENDKSPSEYESDKYIDNRTRKLWFVESEQTYYIGRKKDDGSFYPQKVDTLRPIRIPSGFQLFIYSIAINFGILSRISIAA